MTAARTLTALCLVFSFGCATPSAFAQADGQTPSAPAFPLEAFMMMQAAQAAAQQAGGTSAAAHAEGDEACNASAIASWMTQGSSIPWDTLPSTRVDAAQVHAVQADLAEAKARLATADATPLSLAEAARFAGAPAATLKPARDGMTPYLVRSVYPVPDSQVRMTWYGDYLEVFGIGEGCAPFTNTPVVVFLDRAPKQVVAMVANGHGSGN